MIEEEVTLKTDVLTGEQKYAGTVFFMSLLQPTTFNINQKHPTLDVHTRDVYVFNRDTSKHVIRVTVDALEEGVKE